MHFQDDYAGSRGWLGFDFDLYNVTPEQLSRYLETLEAHITCVREAGEKIGVTSFQLRQHDTSKFSHEEMPHYARQFQGDKQNPDGFAGAWLHHIHNNPHHWQYWIFSDGFTPKGSNVQRGCVEMPAPYATEMVADWMGASMAYTGSWDMTDWLAEHTPGIRIHSNTAAFLSGLLGLLGYTDCVNFFLDGHN